VLIQATPEDSIKDETDCKVLTLLSYVVLKMEYCSNPRYLSTFGEH